MKDRNEEKRVPSSYLEIFANTPSRIATNWEKQTKVEKFKVKFMKLFVCFFFFFFHLSNQKLNHVLHTFLYQVVYLGVELFLHRERVSNTGVNQSGGAAGECAPPAGQREVFTSWPNSIAHNLADWSLASTITLNIVHKVGEMRKSVDLLLFVSLDSNAILVLRWR